jgi:hypothetical protein
MEYINPSGKTGYCARDFEGLERVALKAKKIVGTICYRYGNITDRYANAPGTRGGTGLDLHVENLSWEKFSSEKPKGDTRASPYPSIILAWKLNPEESPSREDFKNAEEELKQFLTIQNT